jgi:excinuclease ABC subunit A
VPAGVLIARSRRFERCGACDGTRLCPDARAIEIGGRDLGSLCRETISGLQNWLDATVDAVEDGRRAGRVVEMLKTRVATVAGVGLGYMGLDRQMRTLSGGEAQRIQLATALGGGLTASLYVLDEPSIGLHPRDLDRLLDVILAIRDRGNTVVVVEHAREVLLAADHVIDLGPGAGRLGGRVVVEGTLADVRACAESATGRLLRGEIGRRGALRRSGIGPVLAIRGARAHNLQGLDVDLPLERFVVVTGVSGAGKSTLVRSVLAGSLATGADESSEHAQVDRIEGAESIREIVIVDQTPAVRSPRSNPATVSKAFDRIRTRFAATREARALGVGPGWFSFNVAGGRCDACEGAGEVVIDMQFLDDVRVPCDACDGRRYRREVLGVKLDGRSIVDVLGLTIDEAVEVFADDGRLVARLDPFRRVGLGYLALGQPLSTLSGGEHQRVRLALALADPAPGRLYLLDEPTTGLHATDVEVLLGCLDDLVTAGGSVVVIEHDVEVILRADWVIDLGPEGGPGGGRVVAAGTPEDVARAAGSHTGRALAAALAGS